MQIYLSDKGILHKFIRLIRPEFKGYVRLLLRTEVVVIFPPEDPPDEPPSVPSQNDESSNLSDSVQEDNSEEVPILIENDLIQCINRDLTTPREDFSLLEFT